MRPTSWNSTASSVHFPWESELIFHRTSWIKIKVKVTCIKFCPRVQGWLRLRDAGPQLSDRKKIRPKTNIEGFGPEWYISSMLYSQDVPFWSGTLDIFLNKSVKKNTKFNTMLWSCQTISFNTFPLSSVSSSLMTGRDLALRLPFAPFPACWTCKTHNQSHILFTDTRTTNACSDHPFPSQVILWLCIFNILSMVLYLSENEGYWNKSLTLWWWLPALAIHYFPVASCIWPLCLFLHHHHTQIIVYGITGKSQLYFFRMQEIQISSPSSIETMMAEMRRLKVLKTTHCLYWKQGQNNIKSRTRMICFIFHFSWKNSLSQTECGH